MLLVSFDLSIYGNILFERTREISIISNMKMFLNYNICDHGDAVINRSRIIFQCAHYCKTLKGYKISDSSLVFYP